MVHDQEGQALKLGAWVERIELNSACYGDGFRHFGPPIIHYYADGQEVTADEYNALLGTDRAAADMIHVTKDIIGDIRAG